MIRQTMIPTLLWIIQIHKVQLVSEIFILPCYINSKSGLTLYCLQRQETLLLINWLIGHQ